MAYTQRQIMLCMAYLAYTDQWLPASQGYDATIFGDLTEALSTGATVPLPPVAGQWSVVWGPASYTTPGAYLPDNMMYVTKLDGQTDPAQYVVAVRGTDGRVMLDWLMEDFDIAQMIPWNGSSTAFISEATSIGLTNLLGLTSNGVSLQQFLQAEMGSSASASASVCCTGHSLGGTLSATLAHALRDAQTQWDPTGKAIVTTINFAGPTPGDAGYAAAFAAAFGYTGTSPLSFWSTPAGSSSPSYADCVRNTLDVAPLIWNVTTMGTITKLYEGHLLDDIDPPYGNLIFGDIVSHIANAFAGNDFTQLQAAQTPLTGTFIKKTELPPNGPSNHWFAEAEYQHHMSYPILLAVPEINQLTYGPPTSMTLPKPQP